MPTGHYDRTKKKPVMNKGESNEHYKARLDRWADELGYLPKENVEKMIDALSVTSPAKTKDVFADMNTVVSETQLAEMLAEKILVSFSTEEEIKAFWDLTRAIMAYKMKKRGLSPS